MLRDGGAAKSVNDGVDRGSVEGLMKGRRTPVASLLAFTALTGPRQRARGSPSL
jgi:hypothetical protein